MTTTAAAATGLDLRVAPETSSRPSELPSPRSLCPPIPAPVSSSVNRSLNATSEAFALTEDLLRRRTPRQVILHHWECTVDSVGAHEFLATMRSLRDPSDSEKEAEIPVGEVSPDDMELLEVGAVFYWTVGYETSPAGTRRRFSQLKFRRLPAWTKKDLARVDEKADELFNMFGRDQYAQRNASGK